VNGSATTEEAIEYKRRNGVRQRRRYTCLQIFTHAYCDYCETIQPVKREKLENEDTSGQFEGGDILCTECPSIIATVYVRKKKL
jgi:hypothetical protein